MSTIRLKTCKVKSVCSSKVLLKGEGHSLKLTFLFSLIASKHSAFPLTEVSVAKVPAILKKFVSKKKPRIRLQNGGNYVELLAFFIDEFHKEKLHFRG